MSEYHGYLVPTLSPLRNSESKKSRISDGGPSLNDHEYIYPDSYPNGDPQPKTTVRELAVDSYGYSNIQERSEELPNGVHSAIINTNFNQPNLACTVPSVTDGAPWKKRFRILLIVCVIVVVALLITLALVASNVTCSRTNHVSHDAKNAVGTNMIEPQTNGYEIIRCDACTYYDTRYLCRRRGKRVARLKDLKQLADILRKIGDYSQWNKLAWTNIRIGRRNRIKVPSNSRTNSLQPLNFPFTPYLFAMCYPDENRSYNISEPDVKSRVYGVLCQKPRWR